MGESKISDVVNDQVEIETDAIGSIVFMEPFPTSEYMKLGKLAGPTRSVDDLFNRPESDLPAIQ